MFCKLEEFFIKCEGIKAENNTQNGICPHGRN